MDIMLKRIQELIGYKHGAKKELADYLGIHPNNVSSWFNGRSESYKKYAPQIADFYGVSLDYLAGSTDNKAEKKSPPSQRDSGLTEYEKEVLELAKNVPSERRRLLLQMIDTLTQP